MDIVIELWELSPWFDPHQLLIFFHRLNSWKSLFIIKIVQFLNIVICYNFFCEISR